MTRTHRSARLSVIAVLCLLFGCGNGDDPTLDRPTGTAEGYLTPDLTGRVGDDEFNSESLRGSPAVLVIHPTIDCGLCRLRLAELQENRAAYQRLGVEVVALTTDPPERLRQVSDELEFDFPLVSVDAATLQGWTSWRSDGSAILPATYVLDRHGIVRLQHLSRNAGDLASDATLLALLAALPDEPPEPEPAPD